MRQPPALLPAVAVDRKHEDTRGVPRVHKIYADYRTDNSCTTQETPSRHHARFRKRHETPSLLGIIQMRGAMSARGSLPKKSSPPINIL